jgi:energy-coupling factor transporter ATP-binding protein EcfA2
MSDTATMSAHGPTLEMSPGQRRAIDETKRAIAANRWHLITGYAGSGKTTAVIRLIQEVMDDRPKATIAVAAPTHKAVQVVSQKLKAAGVDGVACATLHRLLGLRADFDGDQMTFVPSRYEQKIEADVILIDEGSMISQELYGHIVTQLTGKPVVFIGDPAQLPPINEGSSTVFGLPSRSHLDTIIRQAAGNPIIAVADVIRRQQGGAMDLTWANGGQNIDGRGVFMPRDPRAWIKQAYTSALFKADPFAFRYLAWTNDCVARVNQQVREWLFGHDIQFPIMPGERALFRAPLMIDDAIVAQTNEEALVIDVELTEREVNVPNDDDMFGRPTTVALRVFRMTMQSDEGLTFSADLPADEATAKAVLDQFRRAARGEKRLWRRYHAFRQSLARVQAIYAQTVHTSQGSTFKHVFVNLPDILRRRDSNLLETQQLLYVAVTRASDSVMLVGGR